MNVNHSEAPEAPSSAVYKAIMHEVDAANRAGLAIESIELTAEEGAELCAHLMAVGLATITVDDLSDPGQDIRPYGGVRVVVVA